MKILSCIGLEKTKRRIISLIRRLRHKRKITQVFQAELTKQITIKKQKTETDKKHIF